MWPRAARTAARSRGLSLGTVALDTPRRDRSVGESSGGRCRVVPVAACGGQSKEPMTYANIPLEPTRPASDSCAGLHGSAVALDGQEHSNHA